MSCHGFIALFLENSWIIFHGLPWWFNGKESPCNAGDMDSIPGLGRSPGGGHGNPLHYSCLENSMDREAWRATVHGVTKSQTLCVYSVPSTGCWTRQTRSLSSWKAHFSELSLLATELNLAFWVFLLLIGLIYLAHIGSDHFFRVM